jgi:hypothetical protein
VRCPIVVLGITPPDIPEVEQRLAAAFQRAPKLAITDRDWADAVVALLQASSCLEMTPASSFAAFLPEPVESLGASDPEVERAAPPSFSRLRFLALRADDDAVPPAPAPRRIDSLMVAACAVVFVAELGVAFCGIEVGGLLPSARRSLSEAKHPHGMRWRWRRVVLRGRRPLLRGCLPRRRIDPSPEAPTQTAAAVSQPRLTNGGASRAGNLATRGQSPHTERL